MIEGPALFVPAWRIVVPAATCDALFGLGMATQCLMCPEVAISQQIHL